MSQRLTFVTTNEVKFHTAAHLAKELGFELQRAKLELQEIQSDSGETIARYKANQAYETLRTPIVVTDDSWQIPGLNGFPGPYMKYMNDWLTSQDWLRLTEQLPDRRIILQQHAVYQDEHGQQYFVYAFEGILLKEIRGTNKYGHTAITSFDGGKCSRAETIAADEPLLAAGDQGVWHQLAHWLNSR